MSRRKLPANELKEIKESAFDPDEKLTIYVRRLDYEVFKSVIRERLGDSIDATEALLLSDVIQRIDKGIAKDNPHE